MNKLFLFIASVFLFTNGFSQGFIVKNYDVDIYIQKEGYFNVFESYDVYFMEYKHGLKRTIITDYEYLNSSGKRSKRKIKITDIDVPNRTFSASKGFEQRVEGRMDLYIGDKDKTVIGDQHYEIKYRVYNAFIFEDSLVLFYWNVKPDGWIAPFSHINFRMHLPEGIISSKANAFVYSGAKGDTTLSKNIEVKYGSGVFSGATIAGSTSMYGESVTLLLKLPASAIHEIKPFWPFWDNSGWILIIGLLILVFFLVWLKYGRDNKVIMAISYYPPERMDPAIAGYLINDKDDTNDLIALIPYWAAQGLLKIEDIPKQGLFGKGDIKLIRLRDLPQSATEYEEIIFTGLFGRSGLASTNPDGVLVSSLQNSFYKNMNSARKSLKGKAAKYYVAESTKVQLISKIVSIVLAVILCFICLFMWGMVPAVSIVVTCVVLFLMSFYMLKKNGKGDQVFSELKGFRHFIRVAEEDRLRLLLNDDPEYFEHTMAYALAFGMFDQWASKFDALNIQPPQWYYSTSAPYLSMRHFSRSFASSMAGAGSSMVSMPSSSSSSGGGSSGGGFGGGGGGSW